MKRYALMTITGLMLAGLATAAAPEPLGYWPLAERADAGFTDESGTYVLAPEGEVSVQSDRRFGSCVRFKGRLVFPEKLVQELNKTQAVTLACWLWTEHTARDASWQPFFNITNPGLRQIVNMNFRWNGLILQQYSSTQYDTRTSKPHGTLEPYRWAHVVLTWDGTTARFWFNGHGVGEKTIDSLEPGLRGSITLGSREWGGLMAHLRVYDRTLDEAEITDLIALNRPKDLPGEKDPVPNCPSETLGEKKRETGYTIRELKTCFPPLEQWPDWDAMAALDPTFAAGRFKSPPEPYVHPRVLFNAEDLPAIRERLNQTVIGKKMMQSIRGRCLQLDADPSHWEAIPYGAVRKSDLRAEYLERGIDIGGGRSGYHGPWLGGMVDELASGKMPEGLEEAWGKSHYGPPRHYLVHQMPYEAFRCLLDEDPDGAGRIGRALATLCRRFMGDPEIQKLAQGTEWQPIYQRIHSQAIGLTYDFACNQMSEDDRDDVRKFIAMVTANKKILPTQHLPAFPGNTTNWLIIHANMLPMVLAIEGEEGYDGLTYERIAEALKKWVYVTCGPLGAPFEGFNKSGYAPYWLPYLAKRGVPLCGTTYSKNVARKYNLHMMVPWGGQFIYETEIGPVNPGIEYFKYAHPTDPVIDMMYGYTVKDRIQSDDFAGWPNIRTTYPPQYETLFVADDPIGVENGQYDWHATFEKTMQYLKDTGEPLVYYSDYRGVMTARSGWDKDAVMFYMEPRNVPGGHTHASRNEFIVVGLGRKWSERPKSVEANSTWHSVILIDGKGQAAGGKCPPGRTVAVVDRPQATFMAGDAARAYSHTMVNKVDFGQPIDVTPNQSRLKPSPLPWMNQPWSFLPQWFTGGKPGREHGSGHGHWRDYNPVQHAFRTGGLIRGKYPYVLVVDDIRKDDQARTYTWQMQLAEDLKVEKNYADGMLDLALIEDGPRRCLVRCVEAGGTDVDAATAEASGRNPLVYTDRYDKEQTNNRLVVETRATNGDTKVLIYPHKPGMPDMVTEWNADRTKLTVRIGKQIDEFTFHKQVNGRTIVAMTRNGKTVLRGK